MDIKRPFEIRIVAKFSTFYGKYGHFPHRFTHFFVVADVYALFDIPSEKSAHNFIKTRGGGSTAVYKLYKKTGNLVLDGFLYTGRTSLLLVILTILQPKRRYYTKKQLLR